MDSDDIAVRRARAAVSAAFLLFGLGSGLWFVHIPVVSARVAISPALFGLAVLASGIATLLAQPVAAALVARIGSRRATAVFLPAAVAGFLLPILAWSTPALFAALVCLGLAAGALNVAMNTQAAEVEAARDRPSMSAFHGFFSAGALAAAALGSGLIAAGLGNGAGALAAVAAMLAATPWVARGLRPSRPGAAPLPGRPRFALPGGPVLLLAGLAFLSNAVEGTMNYWSALFLATVKGSGELLAALGYAAYALAMASCRFAGGALVARLGEQRMIAAGGTLVAAGIALALAAPVARGQRPRFPGSRSRRGQRRSGADRRRQPRARRGPGRRRRRRADRRHRRVPRRPAARRRDRPGLRPVVRACPGRRRRHPGRARRRHRPLATAPVKLSAVPHVLHRGAALTPVPHDP